MIEQLESPFENSLQAFEDVLVRRFSPFVGCNLRTNVGVLRRMAGMSKPELEAFMSQGGLISLNDEEYQRLQRKIGELLGANQLAAIDMGLDLV